MATTEGFYQRVSELKSEKGFTVAVKLNPDHEVYAGHFPGKPVAPGAMITQMVLDEVQRLTLGKNTVSGFRQIKFLSVIDPQVVQGILLEYEFREHNGEQMFTCVGSSGETNYFKLNGVFGGI